MPVIFDELKKSPPAPRFWAVIPIAGKLLFAPSNDEVPTKNELSKVKHLLLLAVFNTLFNSSL